ncbi:ROK family protein [Leptospira ryugenii]|uniref:ROK family protein n=1 Tax=Leptospira ryugenii TaxID=1917863 RepID=A0A2P2DXJ8_9LEPT|nr:ROK family protein [Leptospira ryugenii]GBF49326.1 ROK family protein [Leptospira ryugenii]
MSTSLSIGIDIGGGSIKSGLYDFTGKEISTTVVETPKDVRTDEFLNCLDKAIEPFSKSPNLKGIGVGSPGPLDNENGILLESANLHYLKDVPITNYLSSQWKLPIFYENDANCAALGEAKFGKYHFASSHLVLTLGTGLGGGFVEDGILFRGYHGNGIEIGHTTAVIDGALCGCGQRGCQEAYFSTKGFLNRYLERTSRQLRDAEDFFSLVKGSDPDAVQILDFGIVTMAECIRSAIHMLNPEAVVLVGGITKAWDLFGDKLEAKVRERIFPVLNDRLIFGKGENLAGSLGAASLVFSNA